MVTDIQRVTDAQFLRLFSAKRFLVTGATGNVGRHIVNELLENGHLVRALTRNALKAGLPACVQVIEGDLTKPETFERALAGITGLHLITIGGDDYAPLENGHDIVQLARWEGVQRVCVLSDGRRGTVERAVTNSDLDWTILQPVDLMSNTLGWIKGIKSANTVREPYGSLGKTIVHEADVAAVAAKILGDGGHSRKTLKLTGPEVLTIPDKIRAISAATGKPIRYIEVSEEHTRQSMRELGIEDDVIDYVVAWNRNPPPEGRTVNRSVEQITGRPPRSFNHWVKEHARLFS
ncbi:NAD(P)H-binding protein [Phyllobacterium sp. 628]|uniref:NAD(P)H-binding protein n=1 Tax=Phyllobacterium sp. 628 TaxID=2718938 RepID=UPI00166222F6|nr:NAD(P)H-binding protein [Phyllobacterium sp. 628]QND53757.1 NAD(P)H-binding protein [Phyllobacterium sp. 628]